MSYHGRFIRNHEHVRVNDLTVKYIDDIIGSYRVIQEKKYIIIKRALSTYSPTCTLYNYCILYLQKYGILF